MHVKALFVFAAGIVMTSSLAAQQPTSAAPKPVPAPTPAEPPIGAVTPMTAAVQRGEDSMRAAEGRSQVPIVTLNDAINLSLKSYPTVAAAQAQLEIAEVSQRVAKASWLPSAAFSRRLGGTRYGRREKCGDANGVCKIWGFFWQSSETQRIRGRG